MFYSYINSSQKLIIAFTSSTNNGKAELMSFDLEKIFETDGENNLTPDLTPSQRFTVYAQPNANVNYKLEVENTGTRILFYQNKETGIDSTSTWTTSNNSLQMLTKGIDYTNILGVMYKDMFFSRIRYGDLTAGQPDVKSGKTFIGWMGYPETGTNTDI